MIFQKSPTCGAFTFVQPNGDFRCDNGHVFNPVIKENNSDSEVWEHMPAWARMLKNASDK